MSFSRVFVGRLHPSASENDVRQFFNGYGKLKTVMMKVGYCFVDFYNDKDADDAVYDLNFHEILGKQVVVEAAEGTDHSENTRTSRGGSYQRQPRGEDRGAPRNDRGGYQSGGYGGSSRPAGDRERGFRTERDVGGGDYSVERRESGGAGFRDREPRSGGGFREERPPASARPSYRDGPDHRSGFQEERGRDGPRDGPRDDQHGGFRGGRGGFRGRGRGGYESRGGRGGYESSRGRGGYVSRNDSRDASFSDRGKDFADRGRGDRGDFGDRGRSRGGFGDRGRGRDFGDRGRGRDLGDRGRGRDFGDRGRGRDFGDRGRGRDFGDRGRGMGRGGSRIEKRWEVRIENLSSRVSWQDLKDYMRELKFECTFAEAHIKQKNVATVCFTTKGVMEGAVEKINDTDLGGRNNQRKITATKLRDGISRSKTRSPEAPSKSRSASPARSRSASANGTTQSKSRSRSTSPAQVTIHLK